MYYVAYLYSFFFKIKTSKTGALSLFSYVPAIFSLYDGGDNKPMERLYFSSGAETGIFQRQRLRLDHYPLLFLYVFYHSIGGTQQAHTWARKDLSAAAFSADYRNSVLLSVLSFPWLSFNLSVIRLHFADFALTAAKHQEKDRSSYGAA